MSSTGGRALGADGSAAYLRGRLLVLASGALLSIGGPIVRLVEAAGEWQFLFYRALAVVLAVGVLLAVRGHSPVAAIARAGGAGLVAGLCLAVAFTGFVFSITHTTVANTLFVLSAAPFIAALLARVVLGESVARTTWIAMAAAVAGVAVMIGEGIAAGDTFGDLAALATAFGFAGFSVALRHGRRTEMLPAVAIGGLASGVAAGAAALATGAGLAVPPADVALAFVWGVVGIGGGLFLFTLGSREVPAAELTLLSLTEVVLGPIWVWLAFTEVPSAWTLLGGAIVLGAIVAQATSGIRRAKPPPIVT